jgi:ActR/RegA family two-component response regulator
MMHRLTPALVVDADPRGLEALAYGFEGDGWQPTLTPDYADAPQAAARSEPKLAVVVVREPIGPALAALRGLRAGHAPSPLPVLVLGPEAIRQEVRAIAGVDFLALPAFVRDVLTASKLLAATYQASGRVGDELELSASLSDYGLFYLVRTMISLGRSGILQIERATRRGEIRFSEGEVTGATVGSLTGSAALHQLLLWEEAALDLKLRPTVHRGPFNQRPDDLIDEAERFLRDFNHASKELGPMERVLLADPEKAAAIDETLPVEVAPLVRLFDGRRTLGDVIEDSPYRVFDTLRSVTRLIDMGVLHPQQNAEAPGKAPSTPTIKILAEPLSASVVPSSVAGDPQTPTPGRSGTRPSSPRPAAGPPNDHRNGPANRRKLERRDRGTLEQRTLNRTPSPEPVPANAESPAPPAAPAAPEPTPPRVAGATQASGTLGSAKGELRAPARETAKPVATPSVVVDMGGAESVPAGIPVQAPAATSPSAPSMKAVGVMQGRRLPEKPAVTPTTSGFSIEVDPGLLAELAAQEAGAAPAQPATAGEIGARAGNGHARPTPAEPAPAVEPAADPGRPTGRRPSSEFNALESDFFAREADLYKQEHSDSFDDLEQGRNGKGGGPGSNRSR